MCKLLEVTGFNHLTRIAVHDKSYKTSWLYMLHLAYWTESAKKLGADITPTDMAK